MDDQPSILDRGSSLLSPNKPKRETIAEKLEKVRSLKHKLSTQSIPEAEQQPSKKPLLRMQIQLLDAERDECKLNNEVYRSQYEAGEIKVAQRNQSIRAETKRNSSLGIQAFQYSQELKRIENEENGITLRNEDGVGMFTALLVHLGRPPPGPRPKDEAYDLRQEAIEKYGLREGDTDNYWCPIMKQNFDMTQLIAGHIMPRSLGAPLADYLFGMSMGDLLDKTENILVMYQDLEKQFDKRAFVIIPVDPYETSIRWKVVVVKDHHRGSRIFTRTLGDLDGEILEFKNDARPMARFFYYHFLTTMILIRHQQDPGWEKTLDLGSKRPFASFGKWMRSAPLIQFAREIGEVDAEFEKLLEDPDFKFPDEAKPEAERLGQEECEEVARRMVVSALEEDGGMIDEN